MRNVKRNARMRASCPCALETGNDFAFLSNGDVEAVSFQGLRIYAFSTISSVINCTEMSLEDYKFRRSPAVSTAGLRHSGGPVSSGKSIPYFIFPPRSLVR
uniref:ORF22 protein n=1 Tax=Psittacine aviadenovirus B TaxID=2169709 RepID=A0AB38ZPD9_9ADEN